MRAVLGLTSVALGVCMVIHACNTAPNHILFLIGFLALMLGWRLLPTEEQAQDQAQLTNHAYRRPVMSGFRL